MEITPDNLKEAGFTKSLGCYCFPAPFYGTLRIMEECGNWYIFEPTYDPVEKVIANPQSMYEIRVFVQEHYGKSI